MKLLNKKIESINKIYNIKILQYTSEHKIHKLINKIIFSLLKILVKSREVTLKKLILSQKELRINIFKLCYTLKIIRMHLII